MKRFKINGCTTAYEFNEIDGFLTYCYLIDKPSGYYVIDTFCGPDAMEMLAEDMTEKDKPLVVINTHFHWDHIWGNNFFDGADIIAHSSCVTLIEETFEEGLEHNGQYAMGNVTKRQPNITFEGQYRLEEDLTLFHTPGHTRDSISLYDRRTGLLVAGDNLELPLVYLSDLDLEAYIRTMVFYQELWTDWIATGHALSVEKRDVEEIAEYLYNVKEGNEVAFEDEEKQQIHEINIRTMAQMAKEQI